MEKYAPVFDINFWNLYALEPDMKEPSGEMQLISIPQPEPPKRRGDAPKEFGSVEKLAILYSDLDKRNKFILLRRSGQLLQSLDPGTNDDVATLFEGDDNSSVDMAVSGDYLYLLDRRRKTVGRYRELMNNLVNFGQWKINYKEIPAPSRMAVFHRDDQNVAYIGPLDEKSFLVVSLETETTETVKKLDVKFPPGDKGFGREVHLCVDEKKKSLIVADTTRHRIVEIDCITGDASVICGTGSPGKSDDGEIATRAALNSPKGILVYRAEELIDHGTLNERALSTFQYDEKKVKPRMILIADSGNLCVKALTELPLVAAHELDLPSEPLLYTLIGSGSDPGAGLPQLRGTYKDSLPTYPITEPFDLAVSVEGELLIGCKTIQSLIFLRPATAVREKSVRVKPSVNDNMLS